MHIIIATLSSSPHIIESEDGNVVKFQTEEDAIGFGVENIPDADWEVFYSEYIK